MRTRITCCKNCQDRYLNCHSNCEIYLEQRKELEAFKDKKSKEMGIEIEADRFKIKNCIATKKKVGGKK
mgnify:CR=1 FL=1